MQYLDRRQMEQLTGLDPELEHRFRELLGRSEDMHGRAGSWSPPADVALEKDALVIIIEIAGISRDNIRLGMDDDSLVIHGERPAPLKLDPEHYFALELNYGRFERRFRLPAGLDPAAVDANYRDGFLKIRIPRIDIEELPLGEGDAA